MVMRGIKKREGVGGCEKGKMRRKTKEGGTEEFRG